MTTQTAQPYAKCLDCPEQFTDRTSALAHGHATITSTGQPGITARGHSFQVVNPTPEEVEERRIRGEVDRPVAWAIEHAMEDLDGAVRRGAVTVEQVTAELQNSYPDFADAWAEWNE